MTRGQQTLDGIVLRTYDVGEADRLCVLFTRERGRLAARARAVRKLGSRMGSLLLPGRRVMLDVREDATHATIVAARPPEAGDHADFSDALSFAGAAQGIELLLLLTEDGEPLPLVFDLLVQFLLVCAVDASRARMAFQLRLFHLLGFLPSHLEDHRFTVLTERERASVRLCREQADFVMLSASVEPTEGMYAFTDALLAEYTPRELRSTAVYAAIAAS